MGQSQGTGSGSSVMPNWGGAQAGAQGAGLMDQNPTTTAGQNVPWYAQSNYGTFTPSTNPVSTAGELYKPVSADRRDMPAREAYVAPPPAAAKDKGLTFAGNLVANASATGGAYGMPAISYGGGPAYKNAAGQYFYDKEGKYPVPAEHMRLGGGGLK